MTRGDPESPLRWTCKSLRRLAEELRQMGHPVSHMLVAELLHEQKYSLQTNRKTTEGASHPDRNAQFEHVNAKAEEFLKLGQPAISVDTKKKEQVGDYKNGSREWRPKGQPELVRVHDFAKQKDVRRFSFITQNWRGKPLVSHEVIVNLIAATTTRTGLHVRSQLDTRTYPKGIKVSKAEFATISLHPDTFHGDWNYSIMPRP